MTDISGVMMLVQSKRPPMPTSMTATSTCALAKYWKAKAVVSSKKDGWSGSKKDRSFVTNDMTSSSGIISPSTRMRSLKSVR